MRRRNRQRVHRPREYGRIAARLQAAACSTDAYFTERCSRACGSCQPAAEQRESMTHQRGVATHLELNVAPIDKRRVRCGDHGRKWICRQCHRVRRTHDPRGNGSGDRRGTPTGVPRREFGHRLRLANRLGWGSFGAGHFQPGGTTRRKRRPLSRNGRLSRLSCAAAIAQHPRRDNQPREETTNQCSHHPRQQIAPIHQPLLIHQHGSRSPNCRTAEFDSSREIAGSAADPSRTAVRWPRLYVSDGMRYIHGHLGLSPGVGRCGCSRLLRW